MVLCLGSLKSKGHNGSWLGVRQFADKLKVNLFSLCLMALILKCSHFSFVHWNTIEVFMY